jgi:hypothetical protein
MEHAHIAAHCRDGVGPRPMSTWAWIGLGLATWFAVSLPVGLIVGRIIRAASDEQHRRPPSSPSLVTKDSSGREGGQSVREARVSRC